MKKIVHLLLAGVLLCNDTFSQETLQTVTDRGNTTTNSISVSPTATTSAPNTLLSAFNITPTYNRIGGVSVIPHFAASGAIAGTYTNISPATTTGTGTGLIISVTVTAALTAIPTITTAGTGYNTGDILTIPRTSLGGSSGIYTLMIGNVTGTNSFSPENAPLNINTYSQGAGYLGAFTPAYVLKSSARNNTIYDATYLSFGYYYPNATAGYWSFLLNGSSYQMGISSGGVNIPTLVGNTSTIGTMNTTVLNSVFITNTGGPIVQTGTVNAGYSDNTTKYGGTNNTVGNSFLSNSTIQSGAVFSFNITNAGSGYTPGTYNNLTATGGTGTLLVVNIVVGAGGTVTAVVVSGTGTSYTGTGYSAGDVISAAIPGGSGFAATVNLRSVDNFTALNNISTFRSNSGNTFYTVRSIPTINQVAGATGNIYGFYHNPTLTNLLGKNIAFQNVTGDVYMGTTPGNVGIGTTNPSEKLAVKGNIIAQKIKVTLLGWSDYVFDSTYQLEPLHQVEKYIQQNKHLSGVPSAETVQKQGIDVGDNQAVLLKKIEELTLYVIEQNKKLEAQNERIKKLEENNQKQ